jgi:hypothetical protein
MATRCGSLDRGPCLNCGGHSAISWTLSLHGGLLESILHLPMGPFDRDWVLVCPLFHSGNLRAYICIKLLGMALTHISLDLCIITILVDLAKYFAVQIVEIYAFPLCRQCCRWELPKLSLCHCESLTCPLWQQVLISQQFGKCTAIWLGTLNGCFCLATTESCLVSYVCLQGKTYSKPVDRHIQTSCHRLNGKHASL